MTETTYQRLRKQVAKDAGLPSSAADAFQGETLEICAQEAIADWQAIKANARALCFINSVRDPYGCDASQGRYMFERLGGTQIVRDEGHFGDFDDPYPTFDLVDRLID